MAIYRDTGVFYLSITGTDNFQYRPLLLHISQIKVILTLISSYVCTTWLILAYHAVHIMNCLIVIIHNVCTIYNTFT